jgi:hypothetical protein
MSRRSKKTRSIYLARFATPTRPIIDLLVGSTTAEKTTGTEPLRRVRVYSNSIC